MIRCAFSMFLDNRGFEVSVAAGEAAALALVEDRPTHGAVLDYCLGMPETLRVADHLASMSIPLLFLTNPLVDAGWGTHGGAVRLETPVPAERLAAAVKELVDMPGR